MLDYRIDTFLKVCEVMNYRETAKLLNITQPAVTQHIHFLEKQYGQKLFTYENRKLKKTAAAAVLEEYAYSMKYNEQTLRETLAYEEPQELRLGGTSLISDYILAPYVKNFLTHHSTPFTLVVDHTEQLLHLLSEGRIDFALIEGAFNKDKYDYQLFRKEMFVGICHKDHPFANREVSIDELLKETMICSKDHTGIHTDDFMENFTKCIFIDNSKMITELVRDNFGISFVYQTVAEADEEIAPFYLPGEDIMQEFNFVYLKNSHVEKKIQHFMGRVNI